MAERAGGLENHDIAVCLRGSLFAASPHSSIRAIYYVTQLPCLFAEEEKPCDKPKCANGFPYILSLVFILITLHKWTYKYFNITTNK